MNPIADFIKILLTQNVQVRKPKIDHHPAELLLPFAERNIILFTHLLSSPRRAREPTLADPFILCHFCAISAPKHMVIDRIPSNNQNGAKGCLACDCAIFTSISKDVKRTESDS